MDHTPKQHLQIIENDLREVSYWLDVEHLWATWSRSRRGDEQNTGRASIDETVARQGHDLFWKVDRKNPRRVYLFKPERAHAAVLRAVWQRVAQTQGVRNAN